MNVMIYYVYLIIYNLKKFRAELIIMQKQQAMDEWAEYEGLNPKNNKRFY